MFLPILLNLSIIIIVFQIFKEHITVDYIFAYLMVWLFMSTYTSINIDLHTEMKNGRIKYYFIESNNNFVNVYFCRYISNLMKNIFIITVVCFLLDLFEVIGISMNIIVFLFLFF